MAENERDDLTEQQRAEPLTQTTTTTTTGQPGGTDAPLVPSPGNDQQPAGVVPPGGPAKAASDILAEREAEQRVATSAPAHGLEPTADEREHAKDAAADEAKGTPG